MSVTTCVLKHWWKKLKSQFSEQDHQSPPWIWEPLTVLKSSCYWRWGKDCFTVYPPWVSLNSVQHYSHSLRSFPHPQGKDPHSQNSNKQEQSGRQLLQRRGRESKQAKAPRTNFRTIPLWGIPLDKVGFFGGEEIQQILFHLGTARIVLSPK